MIDVAEADSSSEPWKKGNPPLSISILAPLNHSVGIPLEAVNVVRASTPEEADQSNRHGSERWAVVERVVETHASSAINGVFGLAMNSDQQVFNRSDRKYYLRPSRSERTTNDPWTALLRVGQEGTVGPDASYTWRFHSGGSIDKWDVR